MRRKPPGPMARGKKTAIAVRAWALALEDALGQVAKRHRVVLLPAHAIAAGASDLTGQVEAVLATSAQTPVTKPKQEPLP